MAWEIIGTHNETTTISQLRAEYPGLVAYDESGFAVDLVEIAENNVSLADDGYTDRAARRILFWATEAEGENDNGAYAIAEATWQE